MPQDDWHVGFNQPVWIISLGILGICLSVTRATGNAKVLVAYRHRTQGDTREQEFRIEVSPNDLREPPTNMPVNNVLARNSAQQSYPATGSGDTRQVPRSF